MSKSAGLRARLQPLLVTAFCFVLPLAAFGEIRVWKSKLGTYEVRGEMIWSDAESVKLATEDGREIIVALAKLSQADRDYVANQSAISTKTDDAKSDDTESDDTEKKIKLVVAQFYRVVGLDGDPLREFLTDTGRASYDRLPNFYQDVRGPDRGQTPRVTQVTVDDEDNSAVADYQLRLAGKTLQMQMLFRLQEDQWRVSGIIRPGPGGTKNQMDFDNAQTITGATNPTPTTGKAENGPTEKGPTEKGPAANADLLAIGADAYATGFCAKCHGAQGTGTDRGPDLTDDQWHHCDGSVGGIRQVLVSGVPKPQLVDRARQFGMNPATNLVAESELDALAEYVRSLSSGAN